MAAIVACCLLQWCFKFQQPKLPSSIWRRSQPPAGEGPLHMQAPAVAGWARQTWELCVRNQRCVGALAAVGVSEEKRRECDE